MGWHVISKYYTALTLPHSATKNVYKTDCRGSVQTSQNLNQPKVYRFFFCYA